MSVPSSEVASWPLSRIIGGAVLIATLFSVAAVTVGALALTHQHDQRQRVETVIDPAELAAQELYTALLNQETGVRGYALSGQASFLLPYTQGHAAEAATIAQLRQLLPQLPAAATTDFNSAVTQAHDWRTRYAAPTIGKSRPARAGVQLGHPGRQGRVRRRADEAGQLRGRSSRAPGCRPWAR